MAFLEANDIVDLAMQVEKNGEAFYRAVAGTTHSAETRELFVDLAAQEVKHYATFSRLAASIGEKQWMSDQEWDDYLKYLRTTVQSTFFEGKDKALAAAREVKDEKQALRMAIAFEKETLLFFYDLRDAVPAVHRTLVNTIVNEEKSHIVRLASLLQS